MNEKRRGQAERIQSYARLIQKQAGVAVRPFRQDGFMNVVNRYGTSKDSHEHYKFAPEPAVPDETLSAFYEGNGLFAKIIDAPAEEALKHGFDLEDVSDENVEGFYKEALDELDWAETAMTAIKWARLFGGSIIVMLVNDGRGLEEPLDWQNIKSIDDLRVYDRSVIQPEYNTMYNYDPRDPFRARGSRLGMPERYHVNSRFGTFTVHESRCLVFRNGVLPENATNTIYQFWGMPEYVRLRQAVRDAEIAHSSAPRMLDRSVQPVYKMKDLANLLATEQGEALVLKRLQVIDLARGLLNSLVIDSEGEDYDFRSFQFSGVADVVDTCCNYLSALTNIPQTILFGRSPAGLDSTGDSDFENWYSFVGRIQQRMVKSNLRYLLSIIFQAGLATSEVDEVPKIKIEFNALWTLSELEQADLDLKKAQIEQTKAQTAQIYVNMQAIDPSEIRRKLADSSEFDINTMLDEYDDEEELMAIYQNQEEAGFDPAAADPGAPVQYETGAAVGEHEAEAGKPGSAPANAPEATKLPQDMNPEDQEPVNADSAPFGVGVLVIKDGMILTGSRHNDSGYGLICGPGGHGENGETPEQAAFRETEEEFGIRPKELIPIGIGPFEPESGLRSHIFLCTEFEGEPECVDMEMVNPQFRSLEELDALKPSLFPPFRDSLEILVSILDPDDDPDNNDGGPGSGNHGHKGVPGQVGGSAPGRKASSYGGTHKERAESRKKRLSKLRDDMASGWDEFQKTQDALREKKSLAFAVKRELAPYERALSGVTEANLPSKIAAKKKEIAQLDKKWEEEYYGKDRKSVLDDLEYQSKKANDDLDKLESFRESSAKWKEIKTKAAPYLEEYDEAQTDCEEARKKMMAHVEEYDRDIREMNAAIMREYPDYQSIKTAEDASEYLKATGYFDCKKKFDYGKTLAGMPDETKVSMEGLDPDFARSVCEEYDKLFKEYPELAGKILTGVSSSSHIDNLGEYGDRHISLQTDAFANPEALADRESSGGFHARHDDGKGSVATVVHETGHAIDEFLGPIVGDEFASTAIIKQISKNLGMKVPEIKESVSRYACTNNKEFFAEAFAEWRCNSNPGPVAKEFGRIVDEMIRTGKMPGKKG